MRGEKIFFEILFGKNRGSPPHARGKEPSHHAHMVVVRITPAYAGKSPAGPARPCTDTDHPRMRGEKT